ncbi:MAG: YdeI/OmpD-associated family protein [Paracoccaceae bacterium]
MITKADTYFTKGCGRCARFATPDCSTRTWADGLAALRRLCRDAGLGETVKWGHPCYTHAGRNIALIGAFRTDFRLTLFDAALLDDPGNLLQRRGPNSREADMLRFTDPAQVAGHAAAIRAFLHQAKAHAEAGRTAPKTRAPLDLPVELTDALDTDADLAQAFRALTPGRQRSYAIALAGAKKPETRLARIARFRPRILAGKGATEG